MPYPQRLLNDHEEIAVDLHPHWWYFAEAVASLLVAIVIAIVVVVAEAPSWLKWTALVLIVAAVLWLAERYLRWLNTNFVVTSDRVIFRYGVLAKSGIEIPLDRVASVHFNQTVFERIVGAGDLLIESGATGGQSRFTDVRNPNRVQNMIHAQKELNAKRRSRDDRDEQADGGSVAGGAVDITTKLERLEALRDRGTLTDEEFQSQKRRILGG